MLIVKGKLVTLSFVFLRHMYPLSIKVTTFVPSQCGKVAKCISLSPIPDFLPSQKSCSQPFWSRSRYWIPTKLYIYLPPSHSSHTCPYPPYSYSYSYVKCQMSNVKCQIMSNVKCQMSNFKCQMSNVKCKV